MAATAAARSRATSSALTRRVWGPNRTQLDEWCAAGTRNRRCAPRSRSSCASRVVRSPAGERSKCEPRPQLPSRARCEALPQQTGEAQPSGPPRPAQPASGGPPARGRKGARRAVLCRVPAGQPKPHGCRGERGACRRHLAVRDRAKGARLVRDGAGAQPRPPPKASSVAPLLRLQIYRGVVPAGRRRFAFISRRAAGMFTRLQWNRWIATLSKGSNRSFAERLGCSERSTLFARCGCLTGIWPRARSATQSGMLCTV